MCRVIAVNWLIDLHIATVPPSEVHVSDTYHFKDSEGSRALNWRPSISVIISMSASSWRYQSPTTTRHQPLRGCRLELIATGRPMRSIRGGLRAVLCTWDDQFFCVTREDRSAILVPAHKRERKKSKYNGVVILSEPPKIERGAESAANSVARGRYLRREGNVSSTVGRIKLTTLFIMKYAFRLEDTCTMRVKKGALRVETLRRHKDTALSVPIFVHDIVSMAPKQQLQARKYL